MDLIQILLITGVVCGVILVILSFFGKKSASGIPAPPPEVFLDKRLEVMDSTISEADNIISELGGMSENVIKEMDQKYNELLFLYNLIDEKKKEIDNPPDYNIDLIHVAYPAETAYTAPTTQPEKPLPVQKEKKSTHPRFSQIMELLNSGMTIGEVAKELGMGQGEVSLIMSLTKD